MRPKLFKSHRQKPLGFGNIFIFTIGGAEGIRTHDILLAKQALYQLSYGPVSFGETCGSFGKQAAQYHAIVGSPPFRATLFLKKEVIQPLVPQRLPCYDFIPVTKRTLGACLLAVGPATLGAVGFHDVTGGVYKARERIQGAVADAPLLAIPASCSRVAGCNPNWGGFSGFAEPRGSAALCARHCSTFAAPGVRAIRT